jgi:hypothetical protein
MRIENESKKEQAKASGLRSAELLAVKTPTLAEVLVIFSSSPPISNLTPLSTLHALSDRLMQFTTS